MAYKLKQNLVYNVVYQVLSIIVPLVTTPYVSRVLGVTGIGEYSFTFSIVSLAMTFAALGGDAHGSRCIAAATNDDLKRSREFWNVFTVQTIACLISTAVYYMFCAWYKKWFIIFMWQGVHMLASLLNVNWYFYGRGQFKTMVIRNTLIKIITLISIFTFVKTKEDVLTYVIILALCDVLSVGIVWPLVIRDVGIPHIKLSEVKAHVKPMLMLLVAVLAMTIYKKMDKVMIGALSSVDENGLYENADKILQVPSGIINAIGLVMLPQVANMRASNKVDESNVLSANIMTAVMMFSCALACGVFVASPEIVDTFFGPGFDTCILLMRILSSVIIIQSLSNICRNAYLIPLGLDSVYVNSTVYGAIVNVLLNAILIPLAGSVGAAIGTVFAELTVLITQLVYLRESINISTLVRDCMAFSICGALMDVVLIYTIKTALISPLMMILFEMIIGCVVYFVLCYIYLKGIRQKDAYYSFIMRMLKPLHK